MRLTQQQIEQFDRDGYLFFPGQFTPEETRTLTDAVPELYSRREAYNVRERARTPCAPISPPTCTASRSRGWRATRA
jgi:hypothetical protein